MKFQVDTSISLCYTSDKIMMDGRTKRPLDLNCYIYNIDILEDGDKTLFMLNSNEHEITTVHKN